MIKIGNKIRTIRKQKGITGEDLANRLSVTKSTISGWENNRYQPSIDVLIELSIIFNCSVDNLLDINIDNSEKNKLLEIFNNLDENKKKSLLYFAEFLEKNNL